MTGARWGYAAAAAIALVTEIGIALYLDDRLVRPYGGDSLAVVLVYLALRAVSRARVVPATAVALGVAVVIEIAQGLHLLRALGLEHDPIARTVLGGQFDPVDFAAYATGAVLILIAESVLARARRRR